MQDKQSVIEMQQRHRARGVAEAIIPFLPPMNWKVVPANGFFFIQCRTPHPQKLLAILKNHYMHIPFAVVDGPEVSP